MNKVQRLYRGFGRDRNMLELFGLKITYVLIFSALICILLKQTPGLVNGKFSSVFLHNPTKPPQH